MSLKVVPLLLACALATLLANARKLNYKAEDVTANLDCSSVPKFNETKAQIDELQPNVQKILHYIYKEENNSTYDELALFCDTFGPRMSGSKSLESAIDYMAKKMETSKLKVTKEPAMIPKWEVGEQWAQMIEPVKHRMQILALGMSVGTDRPVESEVRLVYSFEQLDILGGKGDLKDKIVVYQFKFDDYKENVIFRTQGALRAAKYGAAVALVRSVTPLSIYSPHTGVGSKSIPTASITVEDADLIERWINRGKKVVLKVFIDSKNFDNVQSYNLIGDIVGTTNPEDIVLVSGHIDSWYNTQGAMDDGGGMMISYKALDIIKSLNLTSKRTIRAVLWTSEEFGLFGVQQYVKDHERDLNNFKVVMESDEGTFEPLGLGFTNLGTLGKCVVKEALSSAIPIGGLYLINKFEGSDIEMFTDKNVPGLSLLNDNYQYFYYHHTSGDSMTVENPTYLANSAGIFAITSYVLANLDVDLRT